MATRNAIQVHTPNLDIFSVYLDDVNEDTRLLQMRTILGKVNPNLPTIILGDMNTVDQIDLEKTNLHMANLAAKFPGPMKSMEPSLNEMRRGEVTKMLGQEGYIDLGMGKGDTLPAKLFPLPTDGPIARFDYAFANKLVKLDSFRVLTEEPYASLSDHYPIWMRVTTL